MSDINRIRELEQRLAAETAKNKAQSKYIKALEGFRNGTKSKAECDLAEEELERLDVEYF